ncbi:MAG: hypothetical protein LKCHEGNO_02891 [Burkholderiaceae bacterium]|nr:hypothetical protein [Burkholderiaceae bacterium]
MTSRLPKHLHDALTAARRAAEFLGELDLEAYRTNALVRSAVERQLEIVGEAGKRVLDEAPELRARLPELELAIGLRNRLIHGYDRVLHGVVVDTVRLDLPKLRAALEAELKRFPLA